MLEGAKGFTVIEVTMFLAISGLLLLMVLIGTGSMAARQRFSDTTDSLQVYFQSQYDEVVNGVNSRNTGGTECNSLGDSTPGRSNCLLLGKLLTIDGTAITSSYVISTVPLDPAQSALPDPQKLAASSLKVITEGRSTYELKWGARVSQATRSTALPAGNGRGSVNSVAFLQMPDSGRVVQVYYNSVSGSNYTTGLRAAVTGDTAAFDPASTSSTSPSLAVCVRNDNDFASAVRSAITFGQGKGAGSITTDYQPPGALCS